MPAIEVLSPSLQLTMPQKSPTSTLITARQELSYAVDDHANYDADVVDEERQREAIQERLSRLCRSFSPPPPPPNTTTMIHNNNLNTTFQGRDPWPIHSEEMTRQILQQARKRLEHHNNGLPPPPPFWYDSYNDNDNATTTIIQEVSNDSILLGNRIGQGSFHDIYRVQKWEEQQKRQVHHNDDENEDSSNYFVVKLLRRKLLDRPYWFAKAAADLVQEGAFLAQLAGHPNIVRLHAWTEGGVETFGNGRHDAFGLVLEGLNPDQTLKTKLVHEWPQRQEQLISSSSSSSSTFVSWKERLSCRRPKQHHQHERTTLPEEEDDPAVLLLIEERLTVLSQLLDALLHLQSHSILHRDLKPCNVGFCAKTTTKAEGSLVVKLFDFDVARSVPTPQQQQRQRQAGGRRLGLRKKGGSTTQLPPSPSPQEQNRNINKNDEDAVFHLTQQIGNKRYRSPEVHRGDPYNLKADVYSWSVMAWEVLTLRRAYYKDDIHVPEGDYTNVMYHHHRPSLEQPSWPSVVSNFLEHCWTDNITQRYTMQEAHTAFHGTVCPALRRRHGRGLLLVKDKTTATKSTTTISIMGRMSTTTQPTTTTSPNHQPRPRSESGTRQVDPKMKKKMMKKNRMVQRISMPLLGRTSPTTEQSEESSSSNDDERTTPSNRSKKKLHPHLQQAKQKRDLPTSEYSL